MRCVTLVLVMSMNLVQAQKTVEGAFLDGVTYVEARSRARGRGAGVTVTGEKLTWRGHEGIATFFDGSSVALLQRPGDGDPTEWPLSAPVYTDVPSAAEGSGWFLPLDAVQLLGVAAEERGGPVTLYAPDGSRLDIALPPVMVPSTGPDAGTAWEPAQMGAASGVRLFDHDQSLLLLDLDMLPLAFPEATDVIDDAALRAGNDHALLLIGTALVDGALSTTMAFEQAGRRLEVGAPYRVHVYKGDPEAVGPGREVAAVVLLPATFSLYEPLSVSWSGVQATFTFRR